MRLPLAALVLILAASAANAVIIAGRASVIDGDTIQIHGEIIRLIDIEVPESDEYCVQALGDVSWQCGQEAKLALTDLIGASVVTCDTETQDRYGRHLARCDVDGQDLATWMAETGWAVPNQDCQCEIVRAAVIRAQEAERGVWVGPFVLPWE